MQQRIWGAALVIAGLTIALSVGNAFAQPRQVILTWQRDPSSTMTITWRTDAQAGTHTMRFATTLQGLSESQAISTATTFSFTETSAWLHRVELQGLQAGTKYYVVIDHATHPDTFNFRTIPATRTDMVFLAGGDSRSSRTDRRAVNMMAAAENPEFVIFDGDFISTPDSESQWDEWFDDWHELMITTDGRRIPIVPALGNHEVIGSFNQTMAQAPYYYNRFATPEPHTNYALKFGPDLAVITLDSDHTKPVVDQTEWLRETLTGFSNQPWKIVQYHVAAWPSVRSFEGTTAKRIRDNWVPVFEELGVRFAIEAHDHAFKKTVPIKNNQRDDQNGVAYLGDGGWGAPLRDILNLPAANWWMDEAKKEFHFWKLTLSYQSDRSRMRAEAVFLDLSVTAGAFEFEHLHGTDPAIGLNPTELSFVTGEDDASNPPSQDVTIWNSGMGGTTLPSLSASSNKPWLAVSVDGGNQKITNTVNRASATLGVDTATVTVNGSGVTSVTYKVFLQYKETQVFSGISVMPSGISSVLPSQTQAFTAIAFDQNGDTLETQPDFTWSVAGAGAISTSGVYTAPSSVGGPYTITAGASIGSTQMQGTAQILVAVLVKRINAGGGTVSGWDAQSDFVNSLSRDFSTTTNISVEGVAKAGPAALYQTCRHYGSDGTTGPVFSFPSSLIPEGNYAVRLHFAEPHYTSLSDAADNRRMTVTVQGADVLTNFSPATVAGAVKKAYVWEGAATASQTSGMTIGMTKGSGIDAFIMGIEIYSAGNAGDVSLIRGGNNAIRATGIFPGTSGQLSVVVSQPGEHSFEIFSLKGAVVASVRGRGAQVYSLNTSNLPAAAYIARIVTPTESVQKTFMITGRK